MRAWFKEENGRPRNMKAMENAAQAPSEIDWATA